MRTAIICGALALAASTASAQKGFNSAKAVMPGCKATLSEGPKRWSGLYAQQWRYCFETLSALVFMSVDAAKGSRLCLDLPKGVTYQQAARAVVRYIEERPQRMHEGFIALATEALRDAWPCRK